VSELLRFWQAHAAELARLALQHVELVAVSTAVAVLFGIPVGVLAFHRPKLGHPFLFVANVAQTIPSLALLGFLLPLPFIGGIGPRTALVTLTIYAFLPIVRTTVGGLQSLDQSVREAGVAMGMTPRQLLWLVELPLAMPSIVAGLRIATVIGVGTATVAAAIGAGGLGEYIFRGLSMVDTTMILAGAIPAAALALVADGSLAWLERRLRNHGATVRGPALVTSVALTLLALLIAAGTARGSHSGVVIGSKNFTEQVVLGELMAQAIEAEGVPVSRKLNLGGTFICDRALRSGDIDVYPEYTGTAVTAVFHQAVIHDPDRAFQQARELYAHAGITTLDPFGFNNAFAILVRAGDAKRLALRTIADLQQWSEIWTPGVGYEFLERPDGYEGLGRAYGLHFRAPRAMDLSLIYKALADGRVDVIAGDATSAQIDALDLIALDDNLHYFPPYDAAPVVRTAALLGHPEIRRAMNRLAGHVPQKAMRAMNRSVDVDRRDPREVAAEFLAGLD
jgi:osmoprotectant transport system substrate-binding protein/osmoprotectant transport system permease protein